MAVAAADSLAWPLAGMHLPKFAIPTKVVVAVLSFALGYHIGACMHVSPQPLASLASPDRQPSNKYIALSGLSHKASTATVVYTDIEQLPKAATQKT